MGRMKELLHEIQEERAQEWIEENYPEAEEGTEEFDAAAQAYSLMLDDLAEQAERQWFLESLNDLDDRYRHAVSELNELSSLVSSEIPSIVFRLAYVHTVTVMEAFLMYSARALLNEPAHLERFYSRVVPAFKKKIKHCEEEVAQHLQKLPEKMLSDESWLQRSSAQMFISEQTFHNLKHLQHYFSLVLKTSFDWPTESLESIVETRQDLVHRNGVSKDDEPVRIGTWHLTNAIAAVRTFIDAVAMTLRRETGRDAILPHISDFYYRDEF